MTNPLVSIIVPVYNAQNSVARCLESICGQTYQELEIIVLNDGSTDDSLTVCNQFCAKDPRVTVVDKENEGLSITRNVGMRLAQGKYLQFVDSDDHLAPDFTQRMVTAAEQHDATLVISPYWMEIPRDIQKEQLREKVKASNPEDIAKKKLRRKKPEVEYREYGFLPAGVYDQKSYALHLMEKPVTFFYNVVWNKLYRRDVLNAHGLEFTNELIHAEDQQFNIRYLEFVERVVSLVEQKVRQAAINQIPRKMIFDAVQGICLQKKYQGELSVEISIPEGVDAAKKTFNPRLGIRGGISGLGTPSYFSFKNSTGNVSNSLFRWLCYRNWICPRSN